MTGTLVQRIEREIKKCKREYPESWAMKYFGNFMCHLPEGLYRKGKFYDSDFKQWGEKHSKLMKSQTIGQVHHVIDNIISKKGIDLENMIRLLITWREKKDNTALSELYDIATPIYIKLREMGYNHYPDLTA